VLDKDKFYRDESQFLLIEDSLHSSSCSSNDDNEVDTNSEELATSNSSEVDVSAGAPRIEIGKEASEIIHEETSRSSRSSRRRSNGDNEKKEVTPRSEFSDSHYQLFELE